MIVADASVVVAMFTDPGPTGAWAATLLREPFAAPHHLLAEVLHVLRRDVRVGDLPPAVADLIVDDVLALPVQYHGLQEVGHRVWELRENVTPYDAWYVALAEELGVVMATLDVRLAGAPGTRCEFVTPPGDES